MVNSRTMKKRRELDEFIISSHKAAGKTCIKRNNTNNENMGSDSTFNKQQNNVYYKGGGDISNLSCFGGSGGEIDATAYFGDTFPDGVFN